MSEVQTQEGGRNSKVIADLNAARQGAEMSREGGGHQTRLDDVYRDRY